MSGYTENSIVILADYDTVFDLTNTIELWPQLFTEYEKAEILKREENNIEFRLTTYPEGNKPAKNWISKRIFDKKAKLVTAERLDPKFPFSYMHIRWIYEELPKNVGTIMTWIQEFEVDAKCPWTQAEMESYLNRNTKIQMKSVKKEVENLFQKRQ